MTGIEIHNLAHAIHQKHRKEIIALGKRMKKEILSNHLDLKEDLIMGHLIQYLVSFDIGWATMITNRDKVQKAEQPKENKSNDEANPV